MDVVELAKVRKSLARLPHFVVKKLQGWVEDVELQGIREVRKIPGYHDEPLKGNRAGQRSIRLTRGYRANYTEAKDGSVNVIIVEEVNKHEY
jgi:proteic killer suppression protein